MAKGDAWTQDEIDYVVANYRIKSSADIARHLNRTVIAVRCQADLLGVARRRLPPPVIVQQGDICIVPLNSWKYPGLNAIIDADQINKIKEHIWHPSYHPKNMTCYAVTTDCSVRPRRTIQMHSLILDTQSEVDHKDGDGLNNRRSNLRTCSKQQNSANMKKKNTRAASQYKGVTWHPTTHRWRARIRSHNILTSLGLFTTEIEAAKAYDKAARRLFGEFARPNFPYHPHH